MLFCRGRSISMTRRVHKGKGVVVGGARVVDGVNIIIMVTVEIM